MASDARHARGSSGWRVGVEGKVYLGRATRVLDDNRTDELRASANAKYETLANQELPDLWLFRIDA